MKRQSEPTKIDALNNALLCIINQQNFKTTIIINTVTELACSDLFFLCALMDKDKLPKKKFN